MQGLQMDGGVNDNDIDIIYLLCWNDITMIGYCYGYWVPVAMMHTLSTNWAEAAGFWGQISLRLTGEDGVYPIEFKNQSDMKTSLGTQVQLAAYGMLCEKKYQKVVKKAFVLYGLRGRTIPINIDDRLRDKVKFVRDKIREMAKTNLLPDSPCTEHQCGQCEFLNFCADRY